MRVTAQIRGKFNWRRAHEKLEKAKVQGLKKAGAIVYRRSQGQILKKKISGAYTEETPEVQNVNGVSYRIFRYSGKKIHPTRLSTYSTGRYPKGFMRSALQFAYDPSSESVVVGPAMDAWLAQLHEFGGSRQLQLWVSEQPDEDFRRPTPYRIKAGGYGQWRNYPYKSRAFTRRWKASGVMRIARYRARPYMRPGLEKAMPKIAEQFRNLIQGP